MELFIAQLLTGLASASALFLVACGLTIIFGVTRIVNFAHGSFYMLGAYIAWTVITAVGGGVLGFWGGVILAALAAMRRRRGGWLRAGRVRRALARAGWRP